MGNSNLKKEDLLNSKIKSGVKTDRKTEYKSGHRWSHVKGVIISIDGKTNILP